VTLFLTLLLLAPGGDSIPVYDGVSYREETSGRLHVRFAPNDSLRARGIATDLGGFGPLSGLPESLPSRVTVILAHSDRAYSEATEGGAPEWSGGVALPGTATIVLPAGARWSAVGPAGVRTLRHEWAHLALHEYLGSLRVPRWFDEGYAQWAAGGWDAGSIWRLRLLFATGRAPPLDSLRLTWPSDRLAAESAYLLSASAVAYLLGESGERGMALFLSRWREGGVFEEALRSTFGVTSGQFEEDWRKDARKRFGWLFMLSHSVAFWAFLAVSMLFLVRVRRRRDREAMARLRALEMAGDAAVPILELRPLVRRGPSGPL